MLAEGGVIEGGGGIDGPVIGGAVGPLVGCGVGGGDGGIGVGVVTVTPPPELLFVVVVDVLELPVEVISTVPQPSRRVMISPLGPVVVVVVMVQPWAGSCAQAGALRASAARSAPVRSLFMVSSPAAKLLQRWADGKWLPPPELRRPAKRLKSAP
jgi:hypothetical protein